MRGDGDVAMSEVRCEKHDLVVGQCADCKGLGEVVDPYEGVLLDRFFRAKYAGKCALVPEHRFGEQDEIGVAVHDDEERSRLGYACPACIQAIFDKMWKEHP